MMREVPQVTMVDVAFPARGVEFAPPYEEIPEVYKAWQTPKTAFFMQLFYKGLKNLKLTPRDGVDADQAFAALRVIAGCYGLKHEHKMAAFAYLQDEWFEDITYEAAES